MKIAYWDHVDKVQKERDASPTEEAAINALRNKTVDQKKVDKLAALADYRYQRETSGITVSGQQIETDRATVAQLTSAAALMQVDPTATVEWKRPGGQWITHDKASINAVQVAVGVYIRACFSREKFHAEQIAALSTGPQVDAYDFTTGWPT